MTHDGECDMLKYICPEVEMTDMSIIRHLFCRITDYNLIKQYQKLIFYWHGTEQYDTAIPS